MVARPVVTAASATPPVTPDELLAHLKQGSHGMPSQVGADDVAGALDAAVAHVQGRCGPILASEVVTRAWHDGHRGSLLLTVPCPIDAVTALVTPAGVDVVGQLTASAVDWTAGIVRVPRSDAGEWTVKVVTATTPERTEALKLAVLIIAAHLAGARLVPLGAAGATGAGFAIPNRARDLMADYTRPAVA